jgi:Patatin-like phospholipase
VLLEASMLSSEERTLLGALVAFGILFFVFLPALYESYDGAIVVWDVISAMLCAGVVMLLLPKVWARIHGPFAILSDLAAPISVLILASFIYGTAQMREVLWIKFASGIDPDAPYAAVKLMAAVFFTDGWAFVSISLLIIALGVWGPARFYKYSDVVAAFYLYPDTKKIADRLLDIMSQANRFGAAWLFAPVLPAIIFYNTLVPTFPERGALYDLFWTIIFYGLLLAVIFLLVYVYVSIILLTSRSRGGGQWHLDFVKRAFPYLPMDNFIAAFKITPPLPDIFGGLKRNREIFELILFLLFVFAIFAFLLFFIAPLIFLISNVNIMSVVHDEIFTINVFLAASLSFSAMLLGLAREQARWYGLYVVIFAVLAFAFFDLDDNHAVRKFVAPSRIIAQDVKPSNLEEGFRAWMASRSDLDRFEGGAYPVYVVAAEGGGIYAAYHAGMFLAAVQDRYPQFAQHVFAISAVSGGTLGASVFASLVQARAQVKEGKVSEDWYWNNAQKFLRQDFLSELTAAALFLDAPARLLPCWRLLCPGARLSRARAMEDAIENAWPAAMGESTSSNPFKSSVRSFWDPKQAAPALLLNTTEVETGERVVVAPMSLKSGQTPGLFSLTDRAPALDVSLSTGIGLSASFPFISPAGWYGATIARGPEERIEKRRLVDGGYADNSGVATALDIIARLQNCQPSRSPDCPPKARFILLALAAPASDDGLDRLSYSLGEVATPLRALDSIRSARGRLAVVQAQLFLDQANCPDVAQGEQAPCQFEGRVRKVSLATGDVRVPLGWVLSDRSREAIECSFGIARLCRATSEPAHPKRQVTDKKTVAIRENNNRLIQQIGKDLRLPI